MYDCLSNIGITTFVLIWEKMGSKTLVFSLVLKSLFQEIITNSKTNDKLERDSYI